MISCSMACNLGRHCFLIVSESHVLVHPWDYATLSSWTCCPCGSLSFHRQTQIAAPSPTNPRLETYFRQLQPLLLGLLFQTQGLPLGYELSSHRCLVSPHDWLSELFGSASSRARRRCRRDSSSLPAPEMTVFRNVTITSTTADERVTMSRARTH